MKGFREFLGQRLNVPLDVAMDLPRVSICGDREIYVENHKGLLEYADDVIRVRMNDGILSIRGGGLRIIVMQRERMVVNGIFNGVKFEKR